MKNYLGHGAGLAEIFLIFFHQLTMPQRKTILLDLVQIIQSTKQNIYLLILFEYIMYNFYEIPAEIIENIQQIIPKHDITLTTNFNQIVTKNNSNYLDGFALKTLYNNTIYNQFYNYLIQQLDFTKINKGKFLTERQPFTLGLSVWNVIESLFTHC